VWKAAASDVLGTEESRRGAPGAVAWTQRIFGIQRNNVVGLITQTTNVHNALTSFHTSKLTASSFEKFYCMHALIYP
jgi:hypothetical protein